MIERNETERLAWNWFISVWRPRPRHRASASEFKVKMKVIKIKHVLAASLVSILNHCAGDLRTWGPLQQSDYSLPAVKNDSCAILFRIVRNIREIVYLHVAFNLLKRREKWWATFGEGWVFCCNVAMLPFLATECQLALPLILTELCKSYSECTSFALSLLNQWVFFSQ